MMLTDKAKLEAEAECMEVADDFLALQRLRDRGYLAKRWQAGERFQTAFIPVGATGPRLGTILGPVRDYSETHGTAYVNAVEVKLDGYGGAIWPVSEIMEEESND